MQTKEVNISCVTAMVRNNLFQFLYEIWCKANIICKALLETESLYVKLSLQYYLH